MKIELYIACKMRYTAGADGSGILPFRRARKQTPLVVLDINLSLYTIMKKTIITLLALAGVAAAVTEYTVKFAKNGSATLDGTRSHIIFGDTTATTPLTLNSWMLEFEIHELADPGTFFSTDRNLNTERGGLGIRTSTVEGLRITIGGNSNVHSDMLDTAKFGASEPEISATKPITLRLAYDAKSNMAYLLNVGTGEYVTYETEDDYSLKSVASSVTGEGDKNGYAMFWTDSGSATFELLGVTDMSSLAGDDAAFVTYVKTKTTVSIPEPATATLSLLALAGLAMRRRRK